MASWAERLEWIRNEVANMKTEDIEYTKEQEQLILEMAARAVEILEEEKEKNDQ